MREWISTKEAMLLLGVGSTTIKRWADDNRLPSIRTAGGHRRFQRLAVERLARDQLASTDVADTYRWVRWLRYKDIGFICDEITLLQGEFSDWFAAADFLGLVSAEIGKCWADGEYSIVDEHIASTKMVQAVGAVSSTFTVSENAPVCLLTTLTGERHTLGLVLTQLCLRSVNINALWLGVETPVEKLVQYIEEVKNQTQLVALSASEWQTDYVSLFQAYRQIAAACRNENVELILGGGGVWPHLIDYGYRCHSFLGLQSVLKLIDNNRQEEN